MAARLTAAAAAALLGTAHLGGCGAAPVGDEVKLLPGWQGALPSKQYSGFLDVGAKNHMHYVFVEAQEVDPSNAPLVAWFNGGPGASSFGYGYLTELGPFWAVASNDTSETVPTLHPNPTAWSRVANILFIESPSNVGYSYCGTSAKWELCETPDDTTTAELNYGALQAFYSKFPEHKSAPFWIWGESYAGIYVPMLAEQILNASSRIEAGRGYAGEVAVPLQGIGVGNGCLGDKVGKCSNQGTKIEVDFLYGHGAISQPTYRQLYAACPDFTSPTTECNRWLDIMSAEAGAFNGCASRPSHPCLSR